jgi:YegS/Rv2252/BmrU family lipid kinase
MRVALICNPVSGNGRSRHLAPRIERILKGEGHDVALHWTAGRGDATTWARERSAGFERILVVGGDGTLNELVNGLDDPGRVPLAQLATGTANLLAHDVAWPRKPRDVARMLEQGKIRRIDMGVAGQRRFLLVASVGFDAMVTRDIERNRTATLGYFGYARPVLRVLRTYRPLPLSVEVDDAPAVPGEWVVISNTRNYGGLFTMADRAAVDSGHLDVCVLRSAKIGRLIGVGLSGLTGGLSARDDVTYLTGRRVRIHSEQAIPFEIDGDYVGETPLEVELIPAAVPILVQ